MIKLPVSLRDARGKAFSLLWQLWLHYGPRFETLRALLGQITSIVSDMGTERLICDMHDILPEFFARIDPSFDLASHPAQCFLFPRAMMVQGWKHTMDLMFRKGLSSLRFFPGWLTGFKALVGVLRSDTLLVFGRRT